MDAEPNAEDATAHRPFFDGVRSGFGNVMAAAHFIVIHETSGWPSYESANNFLERYTCLTGVNQGIGPQFYVDASGTAFQPSDSKSQALHLACIIPHRHRVRNRER
jgi:hypothetical protein